MFLGTYEPVLDDKGRLILPAKFREQLAGGLVLTRGADYCLAIYTVASYQELLGKLQMGPMTDIEVRTYRRLFTSGANDQIPDKQGRITIPASLREYAGLSKELSVIGTGDHVEVWDRAKWNDFLTANESGFAGRENELIPGIF